MNNLGNNLKYLLKTNTIKQDTFAKSLNVSKSTVSSWITGYASPALLTLIEIANYFKIDLETLVKGDLQGDKDIYEVTDNVYEDKKKYAPKKINDTEGVRRFEVVKIYESAGAGTLERMQKDIEELKNEIDKLKKQVKK